MAKKIPLIYRKIIDVINKKCARREITPKEFRVLISQFGICRNDWLDVANELKEFGVFSEIRFNRIVVCCDKK